MTSERKKAANRRNAVRSTGPRTAAGKDQSRRNAFRHGLSIQLIANDAITAQIEELTDKFAAAAPGPRELVRSVAAAHFVLVLVQQVKLEKLNRDVQQRLSSGDADVTQEAQIAFAIADAVPTLTGLLRYERRAWARLKKTTLALENYRTA